MAKKIREGHNQTAGKCGRSKVRFGRSRFEYRYKQNQAKPRPTEKKL